MSATTGIDVLRRALWNRNSRALGLHGLKDELKVPFSAIGDFINLVDSALNAQQLDQAAKFLWGDRVAYDEHNLLKAVNQEPPKSLGIHPGPSPINLPLGFTPGKTGAPPPPGPRPVKEPAAKAGAAWPSRPGWV